MEIKTQEFSLKEVSLDIQYSLNTPKPAKINYYLKNLAEIEAKFLEVYDKKKKEGVFFTNTKISQFMVNRALLTCINKFLREKVIISEVIGKLEDLEGLDNQVKNRVFDFLLQLTICDPSCGTGVFLITFASSLINILSKLKSEVNEVNEVNERPLKKRIVENLFGLDINPLSLNLCSLKLLKWYFNNRYPEDLEIISCLRKNLRIDNTIMSDNWIQLHFNHNSFDVIIGNPPYGNILSDKEKQILREQKTYYQDIYIIYLIKAINWIDEGLVCFLVPKSFLLRQGYVQFRRHLLKEVNLLEIHDLGSSIFPGATNEVQILIFEKSKGEKKDLRIFDYPGKLINTLTSQDVDRLRMCMNKKCKFNSLAKKFFVYTMKSRCPYCNLETNLMHRIRIKPNEVNMSLISKIESIGDLNFLNLIEFPKLIRGEEDHGLREVRKKVENNTNNSCFFIDAKYDFHYYFLDFNKSVNLNMMDASLLKGKEKEFYLKPKLLIKHNNIIPETIYTEIPVCFTSSVYSLLHEDATVLQFLCGLLNSSLMQFYCIYGINNQKDTTINLNQYMIRHLPIIRANDQKKREIGSRVAEIIQLNEKNKDKLNNQVIKLIQENDELIFDLYSITLKEKEQIIYEVKQQIEFFKKVHK